MTSRISSGDRAPATNWLLDSMYMWYSRFSELPKTLDFISSILLDNYQYWKDDIKGAKEIDEVKGNLDHYWRYNALDCYMTLFNTLYLLQLMSIQPSMKTNYNDTFLRLFEWFRYVDARSQSRLRQAEGTS